MANGQHAEEFSGLTGMTPEEHEALTKMETNKQIASVQRSATEIRAALGDLEVRVLLLHFCDFQSIHGESLQTLSPLFWALFISGEL